jgi:integral membrane sensor domain MASE1
MNGTPMNARLEHSLVWWQTTIVWLNVALGVIAAIPTGLYIYFSIKSKKEGK